MQKNGPMDLFALFAVLDGSSNASGGAVQYFILKKDRSFDYCLLGLKEVCKNQSWYEVFKTDSYYQQFYWEKLKIDK